MQNSIVDYMTNAEILQSSARYLKDNDDKSAQAVDAILCLFCREAAKNDPRKIDTTQLKGKGFEKIRQEANVWRSLLLSGQFSRIKWINICSTPLPYVPPEIGKMKSLASINLQNVHLKEIPKELYRVAKLMTLILNDNQIKEIAPDIGNLKNLNNLQLAGNQIKKIPVEVALLTNLEILNLSQNPLTDIPGRVKDMPALSF